MRCIIYKSGPWFFWGGGWSVVGGWVYRKEQNRNKSWENKTRTLLLGQPTLPLGPATMCRNLVPYLSHNYNLNFALLFFPRFLPIPSLKCVVKIQQINLIMTLFLPYLEHNYKLVINNGRFKVSLNTFP